MGSASVFKQLASTNPLPIFAGRFSDLESPFRVLVVSSDPEIRSSMAELLQGCSLKPELAEGIHELKSMCAGRAPLECLGGFEFADGSFREAVAWLDDQPQQIPVIMVSHPSVSKMREHILDSLRAGALATICYPYRLHDVQIMLWSVIQARRARH